MIAETILVMVSVIDRFIQLAQRKETLNRNRFNDIVAPAMNDFEAVHKDYLASLARYDEMLSDRAIQFDAYHPVFQAIDLDREMARHLRERVTVFSRLAETNAQLRGLGETLSRYFTLTYEPSISRGRGSPMSGRTLLSHMLRDTLLPENKGKDPYVWAHEAVMSTTRELQDQYGQILSEFNKLKQSLLEPI